MSGIRGNLVRVVVFAVVAALCAAFVVVAYGSVRFGETARYTAEFVDASGLKAKDDVRVAGVTVGRVESVDVGADNLARVEFSLRSDVPVEQASEGAVRYKNLLGQRYLELLRGAQPTPQLADGGVIPASRTRPAIDLDELYNGFTPLFEGLQPAQVNQLAESLISVLQGQGGSVRTLLGQIGTLTGTLADRDRVIGEVVTNLNGVLGTLDARKDNLHELVTQLQTLVSGLAADRGSIGRSLERADHLAGTVESLVREARPDVAGTVHELDRLTRLVNDDSDRLNVYFQQLPGYYQLLGRAGIYQQGFQFYLCGVQVRLDPGVGPPIMTDTIASQEARCQF
ncbi:MCE family protein [Pseudonocardia alni]|uniref:MCE family protein n=1 Tax=Pseudonocardia alni TaxID=33907 RepID=UPI0033DC8FDF